MIFCWAALVIAVAIMINQFYEWREAEEEVNKLYQDDDWRNEV